MIVFGTDGWRGIIARDFTFDNLQLVAVATGNYVRRIEDKNPAVVIGYDTRFMSKDFAVETLNPPQQVESAVNSLWKGATLVTPVGGGVQIRPNEAVDPTNMLQDEKSTVKQARAAIDLSKLGPEQWWWD